MKFQMICNCYWFAFAQITFTRYSLNNFSVYFLLFRFAHRVYFFSVIFQIYYFLLLSHFCSYYVALKRPTKTQTHTYINSLCICYTDWQLTAWAMFRTTTWEFIVIGGPILRCVLALYGVTCSTVLYICLVSYGYSEFGAALPLAFYFCTFSFFILCIIRGIQLNIYCIFVTTTIFFFFL